MYTPIDQKTVDEKIHHFIESKSRRSSWQLLKDRITEQFATPAKQHDQSKNTISYEPLAWSNSYMTNKIGHFRKMTN